jgi:hypothetical protein
MRKRNVTSKEPEIDPDDNLGIQKETNTLINENTVNNTNNNNNNENKENTEENKPKRKNSLLERSKTANWFYNVFMKKMDKYAYTRAMTLFCLCGFFLGNNLRIFLWIFIFTTIYLMIYRLLRFWTKRYLLYMTEFCYLSNVFLIAFLLFFNKCEEMFIVAFICTTGIMTSAVFVFNNTTQFNSTDHLTSSWVHTLPLIISWAIRWRHYIYTQEILSKLNFDFIDFSKIEFKFDNLFWRLVYYPVLFWLLWAVLYFISMGFVLKKFTRNLKYFSGLNDFKEFMKARSNKVCEKDDSFFVTLFKYLLQHFSFLVIMFPVSLLCFYSFYFNTVYIFFIMVYLGWNTARNNFKYMNKLKAKGQLVEEEF